MKWMLNEAVARCGDGRNASEVRTYFSYSLMLLSVGANNFI